LKRNISSSGHSKNANGSHLEQGEAPKKISQKDKLIINALVSNDLKEITYGSFRRFQNN